MIEVAASTANFTLTPSDPPDEGQLIPMVEVILITSEPKYSVDQVGQLVRQRETDTFRFAGTADAIRCLSERLAKYAKIAEEIAERADLAEKAESEPAPAEEPPKEGAKGG